MRQTLRTRFGTRLREVRLSRELTQERLAEKADISLNFLNLIERGQRAPSFDKLERLAKVLRIEVSELFVFSPTSAKPSTPRRKVER